MKAFIEIARLAFFSQLVRIWPWLVGVGLIVFGLLTLSPSTQVELEYPAAAVLVIAAAGFPVSCGDGWRRAVHGGPLGLAVGGFDYRSTVAYGAGVALLASPFVLLLSALLVRRGYCYGWFLAAAVAVLFSVAWLGAAAGRLLANWAGVAVVAWAATGAVWAAALGVADILFDGARRFHFVSLFQSTPAMVMIFALGLTQLLVWCAVRLDDRPIFADR